MNGFWFKSDLFEIEKGEDEETNPQCYGKQLSSWLKEKFIGHGYEVEDVIPEDWGWCLICSRKPYSLWVGCGSIVNEMEQEDSTTIPDKSEIIWHCFVVAEVPFLKKLFGRINTQPGIKKLSQELESILLTEPEIEPVPEP